MVRAAGQGRQLPGRRLHGVRVANRPRLGEHPAVLAARNGPATARGAKRPAFPKEVRFQTRHEQALEMLEEQGHLLPHAWIAGDDEMGRSGRFRRDLNDCGERYLLAVPCDMLIRDLDAALPQYQGRGAVPKRPLQRVDHWRDALSDDAWTRINVRDGEKGPLEVEVATCRVRTKINQRVMKYDETLVVIRSLDEEGATKYDFYFSNAPRETPVKEFARVALGGPSHRGSDQTRQERGGIVALRSSQLARLASPSGSLAHRHVVLGA